MNNTRIYLYKSATTEEEMRGQELTKYLLLPDIWTDNLDDTLDTAEIVLEGLPFREEFPPTTKFIIDKGAWQYDDNGVATSFDISETFHWVVENDTVTQPILSDDAYFRHTISLIEPAVIMQHRLCDNISVTYQLKDVTLDHPPVIDVTNKVNLSIVNDVRENLTPYPYGAYRQYIDGRTEGGDEEWNDYYTIGHRFEWIMPDWYTYINSAGDAVTPSWQVWRDLPANFKTNTTQRIILPLPLLKCSYGQGNTFVKNGYCSYNVVVERAVIGSITWQVVQNASFRVNPTTAYSQEAWTSDPYKNGADLQGNVTGQGWIVGNIQGAFSTPQSTASYVISPTKVAEFDSTVGTRVLDFVAEANYTYRISLTRNVFITSTIAGSGLTYGTPLAIPYAVARVGIYWKYQWYASSNRKNWELTPYTVDMLNLSVATAINFPQEDNTTERVVTSAPPVSAYYLFNKAQMATFPHLYNGEVSVDQMSEQANEVTPATFFIAPRVIDKLKNTTIVENFYYQKNFWEMAMEVGRYIHGRPKAYFATNDRLMVDFKEYGKTEIDEEENTTKISIYNSRFLEEYLSQVSSYVNNLIQIGGTITEYVVAKSADDSFTVSNDNAIIQTTYPIIEIVDMQCKDATDPNAQWGSMVGKNAYNDGSAGSGFVFGKPVYDILPITLINEQGQENNVNKGVALYYELGDNQILGGTFRLPTVNSGEPENDYALKKVIFRATHEYYPNQPARNKDWSQIQINNFIFKITYRTKDSLRVDQFRPDLRKYLLNGGKDGIPRHAQFYNQQDVLVDSGAFGNNVYGRLIRTGNEIYTVKEWVSNFSNLKKAGELYRIYGNLYYVSKVTHTQYTDHYESEVEFSKDFNRLSEIIGIPSEPRFNPISERSLIDREIAPTDFLYLTTENATPIPVSDGNRLTLEGIRNIMEIMFGGVSDNGEALGVFPKYARVHFQNDPLLGADALPLGELDADGKPMGVWVFLPLSCYASQNSLVCEWDTVDNLSAGDQVVTSPYSPTDVDTAYRILSPIQYCDASGRVDLVETEIWTQLPLQNDDQVAQLPSGDIFGSQTPTFTAQNSWNERETYIVLKDNRERLAMNKTYAVITDSDRFVTSAWLWEQQKGVTYIAFGLDEVTKIIVDVIPTDMLMYENGSPITIDFNVVVGSYVGASYYLNVKIQNAIENFLTQRFPPESGSTDMYNKAEAEAFMANVKSIILGGGQPVVPEQLVQTANYFIMARNVGDLTFEEKIADWFVFEGKPKFKTQPDISL